MSDDDFTLLNFGHKKDKEVVSYVQVTYISGKVEFFKINLLEVMPNNDLIFMNYKDTQTSKLYILNSREVLKVELEEEQ